MLGIPLALMLAAAATSSATMAQRQAVDTTADTAVARPAYPIGTGPSVRIDQAHRNRHTLTTGYAPFGALLGHDGYRLSANEAPFDAASLAGTDILVIVNANGAERGSSAFTDAEIAAVKAWVEGGGSLLLVADHPPFSSAAARLGSAFGVTFKEGFAVAPQQRNQDIFRRGAGLADHVITRGAGGDPPVAAVQTFTGSAFEALGVEPLITLGTGFVLLNLPAGGGQVRLGEAPQQSAAGLLQGAVRPFGRGRIAVIGEAAMLTAQTIQGMPQAPEARAFGFGAEQNRQFVLNLLHWLSRRPGY